MAVASFPADPRCLVDGRPGRAIDVTDRGLCLGDGVFETVAVRDGRPCLWERHMVRLAHGCAQLLLTAPERETLERECARLVGDDPAGSLRLTVTRGPGPRGYALPATPAPTRVLAFHPGAPPARGGALRLCWCETRLAVQPRLAGIKHLNRLEQVLGRAEWNDPCIDEGIMRALDGRVIECTSTNLFLVQAGRLVTPALDDCGVRGVMRAAALELAADAGIEAEVRDVDPAELDAADEVFVTSALRGIAAVGRIGAQRYPAPGPVTGALAARIDWMECT